MQGPEIAEMPKLIDLFANHNCFDHSPYQRIDILVVFVYGGSYKVALLNREFLYG
jgi:hypothetical protein